MKAAITKNGWNAVRRQTVNQNVDIVVQNAEKWKNLVDKVDLEKDPGGFWKQVNRMLGRNSMEGGLTLKNQNGRELKTDGEVERAFRGEMERIFRIGEDEYEEFNPDTEGVVETWLGRRENQLRNKRIIHRG